MLPQSGVAARQQQPTFNNTLSMLAGFCNLSSLNVGGSGANANSGGLSQALGVNAGASGSANGSVVSVSSLAGTGGGVVVGAGTNTGTAANSQSMGLPASPLSLVSSNLNLSAASSTLARHQQEVVQQLPLPGLHHSSSAPSLQQQSDHMVQQQQGLNGQHQVLGVLGQQQLQSGGGVLGPVKMEVQSKDSASAPLLVPKVEVKAETDLQHHVLQQHVLQRSDSGISSQLQQRQELIQLQQQQQRQQMIMQQRMLQQQQHHHQQQQQQQLLQSIPQLQRAHLQQQQLQQQQQQHLQQQQQQLHQQQLQQQQQQQQQQQKLQLLQQQQQQQLLLGATPMKTSQIEPGMCARRLMQYMYHQRHRPPDNNITFWRKFVAEYFGPRAKKRWCVSQYGSGGRQPNGVFPQDVWHCEICGATPGRGFETTVEVLPRLSKIKYDSGILDELLFVDLPHEYRLSSGHLVLEYGKAIQESVFESLRVVRDGQLKIIFNPDLKIKSWEFCARGHEELIPRRSIVPQVTQLANIAQKYNAAAQNGGSGLSLQEMQANCHLFVTSSRQLARSLEAPPVNDLGYTKRYVRCLQISEVVNSMKDLIDFSRENSIGSIESLLSFPRRTATSAAMQSQPSQQADPHVSSSVVHEQVSGILNALHLANGANHAGSSLGSSLSGTPHNANVVGSLPSLVHPNSLNSLQNTLQTSAQNSLSNSLQGPSTRILSSTLQQASQTNPASFQNPLPSLSGSLQSTVMNGVLSNSLQQNSMSSASLLQQNQLQSPQISQQDTQNVVQHLLQEMMMSQHVNGRESFQQGLGGNMLGGIGGSNMGSSGYGVLSGVTTGGTMSNGSGALGNSNGVIGNHVGGNNTLVANALSSNIGSGLSGNIRNMGSNMNSLGNVSALSGRLNLSSVTQSQSMQLQDANHSLQHDVTANGLLGTLGTSAGFGGLQFNWKSP